MVYAGSEESAIGPKMKKKKVQNKRMEGKWK